MKKTAIGIFLILGCLVFSEIPKNIRFNNINSEDGLPNDTVYDMAQDSEGFIWFGTRNGLARYDGHSFKTYIQNDTDENSIVNNTVTYLYNDTKNNLWIGTANGISKKNKERIINYPKNRDEQAVYFITDINEINGLVYFVTLHQGIFYYNEKEDKLESLKFKDENSNDWNFYSVDKFKDEEIVLTSLRNGIIIYNVRTEEHKNLQNSMGNLYKEIGTDYIDVLTDKAGITWITSFNKYLIRYDNENNNMQIINMVELLNLNKEIKMLQVLEEESVLWINTHGDGLIKYDKIYGTAEIFVHNELSQFGISSNYPMSLLIDDNDILWIGTNGEGVDKYNRYENRFGLIKSVPNENSINSGRVTSIYDNNKNRIWFTHQQNGISLYDKKQNKFIDFISEYAKDSITSNNFFAVYEDEFGYLWLGTNSDGLYRYKIETGEVKQYLNSDKKDGLHAERNIIFRIFETRDKELWFVSYYSGVNIYNRETDTFTHIKHDPKDENSLSNNTVNAIFEDSQGLIWLGTDNGLNRLNRRTGEIKRYFRQEGNQNTLGSNTITSISQNKKDILWIGTMNGGLNKFYKDTEQVKRFNTDNGLPDNNICAILFDSFDNLWASCFNGIFKFDPTEENIQIYKYQDGLQGKDFYWNSFFKNEDNEFYFGGNGGVNLFNPLKIRSKNYNPPIRITDFKIYNESVDINLDEVIQLEHNIDFFSIEFASLDYAAPEKINYRYRLGDSEWIDLGNRRYLTFVKLESGKYNLEIQGTNSHNVWSENSINLMLEIKPAPWNTPSAYVVYIAIVLLLIYLVQSRYIKYKQMEIEKKSALESNRYKNIFIANTSHEIRTPLNGIIGTMDLLKRTELTTTQDKYVTAIKNSANQLLKILNDILDISKIEAGKTNLEEEDFELKKIIQDQKIMLFSGFEEKGIEFNIDIDEEIPDFVVGDSLRVNQILFNLISNSLKYTESGGKVNVRLSLREQSKEFIKVEFCVEDTGVGIPQNRVDNIFERYLQTDSKRDLGYGGVGLGLSITKKLVNLMGGTIEVKSIKNVGTKFTFDINFKNSMNKKKEKIKLDLNTKILIIEDDKLSGFIIKDLFRNINIDVDITRNIEDGLKDLKTGKYNVVISDLHFGANDDNERVVSEIRKINETIPLFIISADDSGFDNETLIKYEISGFLLKPISLKNLKEKFDLEKIENFSWWLNSAKEDKQSFDEMINHLKDKEEIILKNTYKFIENNDVKGFKSFVHQFKGGLGFFLSKRIIDTVSELQKIDNFNEDRYIIGKVKIIKIEIEEIIKKLKKSRT